MKAKSILMLLLLLFVLGMSSACSDDKEPEIVDPGTEEPEPEPGSNKYELSYWVDIDLRVNNGRGYWFKVSDYGPDITPPAEHIRNACAHLKSEYCGNKLYVIYHRQFEPAAAKSTFTEWKKWGDQQGLKIVPTIVLQDYSANALMNFTDDEILELTSWCNININADELGIYDVYPRHHSGSVQDIQIAKIKEQIGDKLVHVGLQPGHELNEYMKSGVEDTWTAECQGLTNDLWENPVYYKGTFKYGRKLLEDWVKERKEGKDSRKIVWNMIPVAWDYDNPVDPLGYISPGDNALTNDPPIEGRIALCHKYIELTYKTLDNPKFGGYSCDLRILELNSAGRPEIPTFYQQLREGNPYEGIFSGATNQISQLFSSLKR